MKNLKKSGPVTGSKAGGDGTKAKSGKRPMIGSKAETASARKRLVGILEEYEVSVTGFDGLRSDAYEKHLAGRSLAELEEFYGRLLNPSEGCEKIREACLPWGEGSGYKDKLPSARTLSEIKERILTERRLAEMAPRLQALAQVARSLTGLPVAERAVVLQGMQALIAAELMELVGNGKRVLDHLPAVDRVIRAVSAQARVEQTAERCRMQEKALEIRKSMFEIRREEWELRKNAECGVRNAESRAKAAKVDEYAGLTEDEKSERLLERAFGKNPYAEEEKAVKEAQTDVAGVAPGPTIQKSNDECKMTNDEGENSKAKGKKPGIAANDAKHANKANGKQVKQPGRKDTKDGQKSNDEIRMTNDEPMIGSKAETKEANANKAGVPPEAIEVEDEYNKPNLPNGKPWWWQPGTILIAGPSKEYPQGIGKDVVTNLPYCMATGRPAYVAPDPNQKKNDEGKMTNEVSVVTEPVETVEDYERRQREAAEQRRWVERQMRIRDKVNGTEVYFNPYA